MSTQACLGVGTLSEGSPCLYVYVSTFEQGLSSCAFCATPLTDPVASQSQHDHRRIDVIDFIQEK